MSEVLDLSREVELADTRTPQQVMEDRAVYQVWEKVDDLDLKAVAKLHSLFMCNFPKLPEALEKALKADDFDDFESFLLDKCPMVAWMFIEPFWDELTSIADEAVNIVWSEYEDQFATFSESERVKLRQKLNRQGRYRAVYRVELDELTGDE